MPRYAWCMHVPPLFCIWVDVMPWLNERPSLTDKWYIKLSVSRGEKPGMSVTCYSRNSTCQSAIGTAKQDRSEMLKALHTVVFHFLVRPRHLDISAMWRLWISVCHECQRIAFISEIPFVRPVGMLLRFQAGYEGTLKWQTVDCWILMEKWPSWERIRHALSLHSIQAN